MSPSVLIIALALAAEAPTQLTPPEAPAKPVLDRLGQSGGKAGGFDQLVPPRAPTEDARVQRFLGALAGGVVGLGAGMALMATGDLVTNPCFGACLTAPHILFGIATPLLAATGTWLGYQVAGGDGGPLAPFVALLPAALLAVALSSVASSVGGENTLSLAPYAVASSAVLIGGGALALELRARQLEGLGGARRFGAAEAGRVTLTSFIAALSSASIAGVTALLFALTSGSGAGFALGLTHALAGTLGAAAATWGVHHALGGRGSFGAALVGFGIGWAFSVAGTALWAAQNTGFGFTTFDAIRTSGSAILWVQLLTVSAALAPMLALEWSHTDAVAASLPRFQLSGAPLPGGGGMVGATARF